MPKKKKNEEKFATDTVAEIQTQSIDQTIEKNFMPYAMSVIVSRAIPDIDGFKPAHRKLLYTMYTLGLLKSQRTKSANVVGATMHLNPHGDGAIYETLVRLTKGNETLIHPFIDSKGNFGKHYSTDMEYAASRYTEVKLDSFCAEIFGGIDRNAVDMVDNYDATTKEPALLPTSFPNILVSPNKGIAVAMSSSICSFNLGEVCDGTIQLLHNPESTVDQLLDIIKAPDFQGGGELIYNREQLREIYRTGRGSVKLRSKYVFDKDESCIEILQIPYSTTIELIMKKISALVKEGKLKEITDFRDEIDLKGFKLTIDVKRGTDPEKLMAKLFRLTPLQDSFDCNFTVLVNGSPKLLGVADILKEWITFRLGCIKREFEFDLKKKEDRLHLLLGLGKILLDIDKAISIIRDTDKERDVVPNLMTGFDIDEIQAEYIAEIKLRHLNREYILDSLADMENLQNEIADIRDLLSSEKRQKNYIVSQLREIKNKYAKPRQTELIYEDSIKEYTEEDFTDSYNVRLFFTNSGYFKKIPLTSLRANDKQKLKENDDIAFSVDCKNTDGYMITFSDKGQLYKGRIADFGDCKASDLGDFIPSKLSFEPDERAVCSFYFGDEENFDGREMLFVFENGKGVRIPMNAYDTKSNRKKLTGAYNTDSPLVGVFCITDKTDILLVSDNNKAILINSSLVPVKATRKSMGVQIFTLKRGGKLKLATDKTDMFGDPKKFKKIKIPANGVVIPEEQIQFDI